MTSAGMGVGDAAGFHRLRADTATLKADLQRLTHELSTGVRSDLGAASGGVFDTLSHITRSLTLSRSYLDGITMASLDGEARQTALGQVEAQLSAAAPGLLNFATSGSLDNLHTANQNAGERFAHAVGSLNTQIAGRSLFAGDALDQPATVSAEDMLVELRVLASTATTAADLITSVEDWFMTPGGGYETTAWQGGTGTAPPVVLGEGRQEDVSVTALDPAIREGLVGLALAALVEENSGPTGEADVRDLLSHASERMMSGERSVIGLRADLGARQGLVDEARAETETSRAALEIERTRLMEADPYRTATDLEAAQTQLESLYVLTARLSRLTLTEYLR
ncbi:MAG: flagellin [Pseudomonadota bacterium]